MLLALAGCSTVDALLVTPMTPARRPPPCQVRRAGSMFQLVDGRVRRIGYSAAQGAGLMTDAACSPVVRGCMRMLREGSIGGRP
jgi:hypothetical protein